QPFRFGRSRFFGYIEAQVLHAVVRHYKPARIIEIGGGVPTYCNYQAASLNPNPARVTCIEPNAIELIRDYDKHSAHFELMEKPIQEVPRECFKSLQKNDIVFIDSNHVVKTGSEINYIVLELLPIIPEGVLVHFHDIYLPYEYDREVLQTFIHP